jgi:hypothetical protein
MGPIAWKKFACVGIGLAAATLLSASCRSYNQICTDTMDCEDGNELDIAACEKGFETESDIAFNHGCKGFFDAFQDCYEQAADCDNNNFGLQDPDDCSDEANDYNGCMND